MNADLNGTRLGEPGELLPGLWGWSARHPEWHPGEWGAEVWSWALEAGDDALLVDPLVPDEGPASVEALVERLAGCGRLAILITIPYHVRSAERIRARWGSEVEVSIHGHSGCRSRLGSARDFREIEPGAELPGGAIAYEIGRPRRFELPLRLPSHDALAFGDAIVGTDDGLRMWTAKGEVDAAQRRFYRERFAPTMAPLVELGPANVLVGHGPPAFGDGTPQLERAVASDPWYHRG